MAVIIKQTHTKPFRKSLLVVVFRPTVYQQPYGKDKVARCPQVLGSFVPSIPFWASDPDTYLVIQAMKMFCLNIKTTKPKKITPWGTPWVPYGFVGLHRYDDFRLMSWEKVMAAFHGGYDPKAPKVNPIYTPIYEDWIREFNSDPVIEGLSQMYPPKTYEAILTGLVGYAYLTSK